METKKISKIEIKEQKIQLVNGEFTPSQASDIITSLIKQKINFHKLEILQSWEKNNTHNQEPLNSRIQELEKEQKTAKDFIKKMRSEGKKLKIDGILTLTYAD